MAIAALAGCFVFGISLHTQAGQLGANKVDLSLQYLNPFPPEPGNVAGYSRIRRAMADKALADARDAGLSFLRVAVTGYRPADLGDEVNELALWQTDPAAFWAALDQMMDRLDHHHLRLVPSFVWNIGQFPALAKDSIGTFIKNPNSPSRLLLVRFLKDFINRYKNRDTILFYELTNEMNLDADLDLSPKCQKASRCVWDHFTTAEMIDFSRDLTSLIKSLDGRRLVTSGYSAPRPAATHLERRPGFLPAGPDWTVDTPKEFGRYLLGIHQPFDIVSVHAYPDSETNRFGRPSGHQYELVADAAAAASAVGKPLFVGEFGDSAASPFMRHVLDQVAQDRVAYAAIWVWEYYQNSTYQTHDSEPTRYSVEPGYSDELIALITATARAAGGLAPADPHPPPRVVLTWPLPCAILDRPVDLAAVASDGATGVKRVDFFIDGKQLAAVAAPPFRTYFDPAGLGVRTAEIEARAVAASGAEARFASTVRLNGTELPCVVPP